MAAAQARFSTESSLKGPQAMELLDEAISLVRKTPLAILSIYYLGAIPYCLMLIYFWFDMSQSVDAQAHLAVETLVLAGAYFWMKTFQAVFSRQLLVLLEGGRDDPWTFQRWINTALIQIVYGGSLFIVYPLSILAGIPFAWVNGFYHNVSIMGTRPQSTLASTFKEAAGLARLWPKQNHLLIGIQLIASVVLFLNLAIFFTSLPQLLSMFFGIETVFTENESTWNNSSFYLDVFIFCFLIINPINKAIYALRCFYGQARINGADIDAALRHLHVMRNPPAAIGSSALVLVLLLLVPCARADDSAAATPPPVPSVRHLDPTAEKLNQAIESTLRKDEFSWRLPRPAVSAEQDGIVLRTFRGFLHFLKDSTEGIFKMIGKFLEWLLARENKDSSTSNHSFSIGDVPWRALAWILIIVLLLVLLYGLIRLVRHAPKMNDLQSVDASPVRTVDLEAEEVRADDLPEDSWLKLAQELIDRGEFRLALRALYLATLSFLARSELVRLAPAKSNRDYLQEMTRRLRGNTAAAGFFRENINLFEASWYGTHDVTSAVLDSMRVNHQQVRSHAAA